MKPSGPTMRPSRALSRARISSRPQGVRGSSIKLDLLAEQDHPVFVKRLGKVGDLAGGRKAPTPPASLSWRRRRNGCVPRIWPRSRRHRPGPAHSDALMAGSVTSVMPMLHPSRGPPRVVAELDRLDRRDGIAGNDPGRLGISAGDKDRELVAAQTARTWHFPAGLQSPSLRSPSAPRRRRRVRQSR